MANCVAVFCHAGTADNKGRVRADQLPQFCGGAFYYALCVRLAVAQAP